MKSAIVLVSLLAVANCDVLLSSVPTSIRQSLERNECVNIFVSMEGTPDEILNSLDLARFTRDQKLNFVGNTLQHHAKDSQKHLLDFLKQYPEISYDSFWITNQVYVKNVDASIFNEIIAMANVAEITEDGVIQMDEPLDLQIMSEKDVKAVEWSVNIIGAQEVWAMGYNGTGIKVANIDSGVRASHISLKNNYVGVGNYGWFDGYYGRYYAYDDHGHGTHVMGTIAGNGKRGIGVAPGATWMACKGCDYNLACSFSALLKCGQFMACPTKTDGSSPDCTKAPRIVNNSWGARGGGTFYDQVLRVWQKVGIIPVFCNGNSGSNCRTVWSPADSRYTPVVAVGATTSNEQVSSFSSIGPGYFGHIKPDIAAPGSQIVSAYHNGDNAFATMSGTSMASPHAAGVLALILQAHPEYNYAQATSALYKGATHTVHSTGYTCGGIPQNKYPNNYVGYGRISAVNSLKL